jgi:hypothetical protein
MLLKYNILMVDNKSQLRYDIVTVTNTASPVMKSKKHLFPVLDTFFNTDRYTKLKLNSVSNETYGRDSRIYIKCESNQQRIQLESVLNREGFKVHTSYWPGSARVEVSVSYFKGERWAD